MLPNGKRVGDYIYYCLIVVLSCIALFFLPMLGSELGMGFVIPNTFAGWVVFVASKLLVATINVLLFHAFVKQARVNIKDDPVYLEAVIILQLVRGKTYIPRSLEQFNKQEYSTKMVTVFITSIFSALSLSQAILTYDWMSLLTYLFTITMGIIFGIFEMKKYEEYYIGGEYLDYARMVEREMREAGLLDEEGIAASDIVDKVVATHNDTIPDTGGDAVLVSTDSPGDNGNTN